jgi:hypothetical protein
MDILYSLGGISESAIYIFYRGAEPITLFKQFRGKRLTIGIPGTAVREIFLEVLSATDALDASTQLLPMDFTAAADALIAGEIDIAVVPRSDITFLQTLGNCSMIADVMHRKCAFLHFGIGFLGFLGFF